MLSGDAILFIWAVYATFSNIVLAWKLDEAERKLREKGLK